MDKLKPCPFCGSVAEMHTRYESFDDIANKKNEIPKTARLVCEKKYPNRPKYYVYRKLLYIPRCIVTDCMGRNSRAFESKQKAIDLWNMRAKESDTE
jgi:hypothetical protein